jgi:hypothetical protein
MGQTAKSAFLTTVILCVACGGPSSGARPDRGDSQSVVESFNGGYTPVILRDTLRGGQGVRRCGLSLKDDGSAVLTAVAVNGNWFQAKIASDGTVPQENVNVGIDFASALHGQAEDEYFSGLVQCDVTSSGSVSLR